PLGNYHNMADLDAVQRGSNEHPPAVAREFISTADAAGMVDLLAACFERLADPPPSGVAVRIDKLWHDRRGVLGRDMLRADA
ncbi:MAG: hypothetical protein ACTS22_09675, partial [Phycisphaerales bacterium]